MSSGEHQFTFSVETYQVSSSASIWLNNSMQNLLELTKTTKIKLSDSITTEAGTEGAYTLYIKKVNADKNDEVVENVSFKVDNKEHFTGTDGIATVISDVQITKNNQVFTHTISEVSTADNLVKLNEEVEIQLKSGTKTVNGESIFYIREAVFSENGNNELEATTENGQVVTLKIDTKLDGETSVVTVTIPNKERIYDLALTKSLIVPSAELIEKYDFNFDGKVDSIDAGYAYQITTITANVYVGILEMNGEDVNNAATVIREWIKEYTKEYTEEGEEIEGKVFTQYYKYMTNEAIFKKFDLNNDGKISLEDGGEAQKILQIYANSMVGKSTDRINYINSNVIGQDNTTTATYNMNKSVMSVKKDDIITYKITVYNEGDYDAQDIEITDYLPEELIICTFTGDTELTDKKITCSDGSNDYVWTVDGKKITTTISDTIGRFYIDQSLKSIDVYVNCKIDDTKAKAGDIIYNVAEISKSTPIDDDGETVNVNDRDSSEDSLSTEDNVVDKYKKNFEDSIQDADPIYVNKYQYNYEDDDDFERIIFVEKSFDLALRKSITKVGTSEDNMEETTVKTTDDDNTTRLPEITDESINICKIEGTAAYFHAKEYVEVNPDDYVEYTIRVYNEGALDDYSGYAKQITDYLPTGLEFYAIVNSDGTWITKETNGKYVTDTNTFGNYEATYDKTNNKVIINCINTPALKSKNYLNQLKNIDEMGYYNASDASDGFADIRYSYQELKIICKVSSSLKQSKKLTNIAEITEAVAVDDNGQEATSIKDRDSTPGNVSITDTTNLATNKANLDTYYEDREVDDTYIDYYPGMEDDDDFETVAVEIPAVPGSFDFELIKYKEGTTEPLSGAEFTVKISKGDEIIYEKENLVTGEDGKLTEKIEGLGISAAGEKYTVTITETNPPVGYIGAGEITFTAESEEKDNTFILKTENPTIANEQASVEITSNLIHVEVDNTKKDGLYNVVLVKTDANGKTLTENETTFSISGTEQQTVNGSLNIATGVAITKDKQEDVYTIEETVAPEGYELYSGKISLTVVGKEDSDGYSVDDENTKLTVDDTEVKRGESSNDGYVTWEKSGNTITIKIKNAYADLALRKFITKVDDKELTGDDSREPSVDLANLIDKTSTTATYTHTKEPVLVGTNQLVTYTIRVYNEGTMDAYASLIKDDIPDGLEFMTYTEGDGSLNDTYRWKLVDENDNEVSDISKAKYIVTDYLAKDENENNLLKGFDPDTMDELDYRDVQVQFKVVEPTTSDRVLINYAQISEETDSNGNPVTDRDSTPNEWKNEDDEDIEKVKVLYFDLALRKWVTEAIVIENGETYVTETGHQAEDDPEEVVKVDLKKSKLNNVTVKFKYSIRITNEGEIAGEATEIRDDIPDGLKFVAEDNPDWREEDGKIVTDKLAGTTLQPGESAEVEIILTWINSEDNMGVMVNTAEISKDHNEYDTPDIDSTPGNYVPGEDDIDDAPVMLSIKTGSEIIMYVALSIGVLAIIGTGVYTIKKKVV